MIKYNTAAIFKVCKEQNIIKPEDDISYRDMYYIVREFHKLISTEVIDGYHFICDIGTFFIKKLPRHMRMIDWGSSNKKKAELISQGKTPYNKVTAPNGEMWFIYFTSQVKFIWSLKKAEDVNRSYMFRPSKYNRENLGRAVKIKLEQNIELYEPYSNRIKSTYSIKDFSDFQTI